MAGYDEHQKALARIKELEEALRKIGELARDVPNNAEVHEMDIALTDILNDAETALLNKVVNNES